MKKVLLATVVALTANAGVPLEPIKPEPKVTAKYTENFAVVPVTKEAKKFVAESPMFVVEPVVTPVTPPVVTPVTPPVVTPVTDPWYDPFYVEVGAGVSFVGERLRVTCKGTCTNYNSANITYLGRLGYEVTENVALYTELQKNTGEADGSKMKYVTWSAGLKYAVMGMKVFGSYGKTQTTIIEARKDEILGTYKVGAGYDFTNNLGMEVSWMFIDKFKMPKTSLKTEVISILATLKFGGL